MFHLKVGDDTLRSIPMTEQALRQLVEYALQAVPRRPWFGFDGPLLAELGSTWQVRRFALRIMAQLRSRDVRSEDCPASLMRSIP